LTLETFEELLTRVPESPWPATESRKSVVESFKGWIASKLLPEEVTPKDWNRFADNVMELANVTRRRGQDTSSSADTIIAAVRAELTALGLSKIPRSISLFQFVLGTLCKNGLMPDDLRDFVPLATPELLELYPDVGRLPTTFTI
jgi:hypothetical protein